MASSHCPRPTSRPRRSPARLQQNTPGTYYPSGPRGNIRNQENQLLYNQTDLRAVFNTGGLEHTAVLGVSFTKEEITA